MNETSLAKSPGCGNFTLNVLLLIVVNLLAPMQASIMHFKKCVGKKQNICFAIFMGKNNTIV